MARTKRRQGQHHGNARQVLLDAASTCLEQSGAAGLSLRAVAERAGLSRQAPYNHFADKETMLAALVVAGFNRLARETGAASADLEREEGLAAAGEAYIAFAQSAPGLFRLMFTRELVDRRRFPDVESAGADAYAVLVSIVETIVPGPHTEQASLAAWCIVHGYATLCIEAGLEPAEFRAERARQFAKLIADSI